MKEDPLPLFVIFQGPLTDLASAYLQEPGIADRLTAIWIGGGTYPQGNDEFNLSNDSMQHTSYLIHLSVCGRLRKTFTIWFVWGWPSSL